MGGMTGSTIDSHRLATWAKDKHGLVRLSSLLTFLTCFLLTFLASFILTFFCSLSRAFLFLQVKQDELMTQMFDAYFSKGAKEDELCI